MQPSIRIGLVLTLVATAGAIAQSVDTNDRLARIESPATVRLQSGTMSMAFDPGVFDVLGIEYFARGIDDEIRGGDVIRFSIKPSATFTWNAGSDSYQAIDGLTMHSRGYLVLVRDNKRHVLGDFALSRGPDDRWALESALDPVDSPFRVFVVTDLMFDFTASDGTLRLGGDLSFAEEFVDALGLTDFVGLGIGKMYVEAVMDNAEAVETDRAQEDEQQSPAPNVAAPTGPDVIVGDLYDVNNYGHVGGISAFAIGTISCNAGDQNLWWYSTTNHHPVIGQSLYRLKDGRLEQIGMSWLKHGFAALTGNVCGFGCQNPGTGSLLGIGCSDPYSASLNGSQFNLGPRSEVNANTGEFIYPPNLNPGVDGTIGRRLQVYNSDLDPAQNGGGAYFVEGQYVTPDDAAAGNQNNNASYRPVNVTFNSSQNRWQISLASTTRRERSAIRAWHDTDQTVLETFVFDPDEGLFILATKATDLGDGYWSYEYALQNLNSDLSAGSFSIPIDPLATIRSHGFHDVDYHSGEPYDDFDWSFSAAGGSVTWSTVPYTFDQNANALRWGTLYNFRIETDAPPQATAASIGLFKTDPPEFIEATTTGPAINAQDCNANGIADSLDIINSTSFDCNNNWIPDECEGGGAPPLRTVRVATGLTQPVYVASPPGDLDRVFIVEQSGVIRILENGTLLPTPFLNIASLVLSGGERGLFSIAFHPDFAINRYFYLDYTDNDGNTVISRFRVTDNPNIADPDTEIVLKQINQDFPNHNGGQLQFGPDGHLYVGMGDGGSGNDPLGRAQDPSTLLGKMLRLDVGNPPDYIPADNPFASPGLPRDEIWALGLRNPWRFSFDRLTGDMYIADVGQAAWEEIDFQPADSTGGENYGWRCMEGPDCTSLTGCTCGSPSLELPIHQYDHQDSRCSITGGYVYRGCGIPALSGTYFFADYCSNDIWSFRYENGVVVELQNRTAELTPPVGGPIEAISSFGEDGAGELYIVSHFGEIYQILPDSGGTDCGNGALDPGEQCDDGNQLPGDGCDANCQLEPDTGHDLCADAIEISEGTFAFDTTGAGTDGPDEPTACNFFGNTQVSSDVWYCYTASCSGTATVDLCSSEYDTKVAVYDGCTCPTVPSAVACNDDDCGAQSLLTFPVDGCGQYLIRVGGYSTEQGLGLLTVSCDPAPVENDCNTNGVDDTVDIACNDSADNNSNGIPDECEGSGDYVRGGRLFDSWWSEISVSAPSTDHPLWPLRPDPISNAATGAETWRCKECHGWDYKGVGGQYGSGSHRTGFPGILDTTMTPEELATLLTEPPDNFGGAGVPNGHDYGTVLTADDIDDLASFALAGTIDDDNYIDTPTAAFLGDPVQGETNYTTGGSISCVLCHGTNGTNINFGTFEDPEYVGTIAVHNPWELMHKIRFAQPGSPMPSWLAGGGTNQGVADIGRYAQLNFPVDCVQDEQCDNGIACAVGTCDGTGRCAFLPNDSLCAGDGSFCNGAEVCDAEIGCDSPGNPCADPTACSEEDGRCLCDAPIVASVGPRYLAISLQPPASATPVAIRVTPDCSGAAPKYVGDPFIPAATPSLSVARLVDDPTSAARLTPAQWGATVYVVGMDIVPDTDYLVEVDCGLPGLASYSDPSAVITNLWGDAIGIFTGTEWTPANREIDILDITASLDRFRGAPFAPLYPLVDMFPCVPDQSIDIVDAFGPIDGFRGLPYPLSSHCPTPCP